MNFSSHQNKLIESVVTALNKDKYGIICDFKLLLSNARRLYKTESLDFWLSELGKYPANEIAMTKYGHSMVVSHLKWLKEAGRNGVPGVIENMSELLFTYCNDHEMCQMQGDFHYYFSIEDGIIYKESEMGCIEPNIPRPTSGKYRVAFISELNVPENELYK